MYNYCERWASIRSSSLARNAGWMLVGQGLSIIFYGLYFVLLGRLLGANEYGIYVGVVATVAIVSQYSPFGSHSVLLRYVSPEPKHFALYWGNVLVTTFVFGSIFIVVLTCIGPHIARSYSRPMVLCVAIGDCLCAQLTISAGRVFQAFERMRFTAVFNLMTNCLRTFLAGFMLWKLHHGTAQQWAIAAMLVSMIAAAMALTLVTKQHGLPSFSAKLFRQRAAEGFIFALSYSTTGIYNDIDKAMLGHFGMNAANGIYAMAYRVLDVACVPYNAIQSAAFPRFFRRGVQGTVGTTPYAIRIIKWTFPITLVTVAVMLISSPIIPLLLGSGFAESVAALRWLCLLPLFRSLHSAAGDALTGAGYQKLRLSTQAGAAAFNFAANLFLIPHYGWVGAAWSSVATDGMLAASNWLILLRSRTKPVQDSSV